jgi:hypothetical protein
VGFWIAYRLSYLSGESVLFAPAAYPGFWEVRSQYYQREVDNAPETVAALLVEARANRMADYLTSQGATYEAWYAGGLVFFQDIQPDVLKGLNQSEYFEAVGSSD